MPLVSVVIPTYNHRDFVLDAIASVLAQTVTDHEIIVVNDGSPDDTAELLKPFVAAGRIKYIEQPNAGQAAARNRGIAEATGEFVALLDDDDCWPPDKLQWQLDAMADNPLAVLVYGAATSHGDAANAFDVPSGPRGRVRDEFLKGNPITSPGQTLIRAAALRAVGGFDANIWGADDWDLYVRLAGRGQFVYEPRLALRYRRHGGNASNDLWRMHRNCLRVHRKHLGRIPRPWNLPLRRASRRWLDDYFLDPTLAQAKRHALAGEHRAALSLWWRMLRVRPRMVLQRHVLRQIVCDNLLAARPCGGAPTSEDCVTTAAGERQ